MKLHIVFNCSENRNYYELKLEGSSNGDNWTNTTGHVTGTGIVPFDFNVENGNYFWFDNLEATVQVTMTLGDTVLFNGICHNGQNGAVNLQDAIVRDTVFRSKEPKPFISKLPIPAPGGENRMYFIM
jgi:hypothetical protein